MIPATVAVTSTSPGTLAAGTTAVQVVVDEQVTEVAVTVPKLKVVEPMVVEKPVPVRVTCNPPVVGASSGVMLLVTGATTMVCCT